MRPCKADGWHGAISLLERRKKRRACLMVWSGSGLVPPAHTKNVMSLLSGSAVIIIPKGEFEKAAVLLEEASVRYGNVVTQAKLLLEKIKMVTAAFPGNPTVTSRMPGRNRELWHGCFTEKRIL